MKSRIFIIGGGLSGRLLALNLVSQSSPQSSIMIRIIDQVGHNYMGPAYSNESSAMLLNVPAEKMGAFSEDPEHFCKWVRHRGGQAESGHFLPRGLYREYILSLMRQALQAKNDNIDFEYVHGEVTDIKLDEQNAHIHLKDQTQLSGDKVVLAIGNLPPRKPAIVHSSTLDCGRYAGNPWSAGVLDGLSRKDPIVFIGTGQTMVDLSLMLHQRGHQGRITAISRRGLLPMAHRHSDPYPSFFEEISGSHSLLHIFRVVRKHLKRAISLGIDQQAVIDALRPDTQALWSTLPESEKLRFLRHVFRYWERIRSRIPPESEAIINKLIAEGQLRIVAGRIYDLLDTGTEVRVFYIPRRRSVHEVVTAGLVVNCIGPETDYRKIDHPLVNNLMMRGLIRPGPAHIGIAALPNGAVVSKSGKPSGVLYTLGATMKGLLWEVIAVPDIRVQAEKLARLLLN